MIISFKKIFVKKWRVFKESKVTADLSHLKRNLSRKIGQWPSTVNPFYPLVTRSVARKEDFGFVLLFYDMLFLVDEFTVFILTKCNGFNTSKKIKEFIKKTYKGNQTVNLEEQVESILVNAGKMGIIYWLPYAQPHIDARLKNYNNK